VIDFFKKSQNAEKSKPWCKRLR